MMKNMNKKIGFLILTICFESMLFTGCISTGSTKISSQDFDEYKTEPMEKCSIMPTEAELASDKPKVAISSFDTKKSQQAQDANIGDAMRSKLEKYLSDGGVQIIDREDADKLTSELQLAELNAENDIDAPEGNSVASYAVLGIIDAVDWSGTFKKKHVVNVIGQGKKIAPPSCKYEASVTGTLRVYSISQNKIVKSISIDHTETKTEDTTNPKCDVNEDVFALAREAGEKAVAGARTELQNMFAPVGYVTEKRSNGKNVLFRINLGENSGLESASEVTIYNKSIYTDPLSGETSIEEKQIATGKITDKVGAKYSWVLVKNLREANKVLLGDYVKVGFKAGLWEKYKNM